MPNILWQAVTIRLCSAKEVSAHTKHLQETLLDISAIPIIKKLSHLPVIVDPSHASGKSWLVEPLAMAAVAAGADGLIIEVHNDPPHALSDGAQSLTPKQFDGVAKKVFGLKKAVDKLN